ncbi:hypothetical protein ACS7SF_17120 [Ralstonia sp. 25C]|uniref:hypothetical protein n=1 Tax=Ralstonia sp. 25C TaxID=3447363 RepID=UPI003F74D6B5
MEIANADGLVIRRNALIERGMSMEDFLDVAGRSEPLDDDDQLILSGAAIDHETLLDIERALTVLGFRYFDDFVEVSDVRPEWCKLRAAYGPGKDRVRGGTSAKAGRPCRKKSRLELESASTSAI